MADRKKDGGWAFGHGDPTHGGDPGMTLRDYFAGQALAGGLAYCGDESRGSWHNNATPLAVANLAYQYADAMLAERDR